MGWLRDWGHAVFPEMVRSEKAVFHVPPEVHADIDRQKVDERLKDAEPEFLEARRRVLADLSLRNRGLGWLEFYEWTQILSKQHDAKSEYIRVNFDKVTSAFGAPAIEKVGTREETTPEDATPEELEDRLIRSAIRYKLNRMNREELTQRKHLLLLKTRVSEMEQYELDHIAMALVQTELPIRKDKLTELVEEQLKKPWPDLVSLIPEVYGRNDMKEWAEFQARGGFDGMEPHKHHYVYRGRVIVSGIHFHEFFCHTCGNSCRVSPMSLMNVLTRHEFYIDAKKAVGGVHFGYFRPQEPLGN